MEDLSFVPHLFLEEIYFIKKEFLTDEKAAVSPFLGANQKNIVWLFHLEGTEICPEPYFTLLSKMIAACKLSLNDIVLVNEYFINKDQDQLPDGKKFVIFGNCELKQVNNQKYVVENNILLADSLTSLINDANLKKQLWEGLQKLFLA